MDCVDDASAMNHDEVNRFLYEAMLNILSFEKVNLSRSWSISSPSMPAYAVGQCHDTSSGMKHRTKVTWMTPLL